MPSFQKAAVSVLLNLNNKHENHTLYKMYH